MNGLDLDLFLRLMHFDRGVLMVGLLFVVVLGIGVWAGFGSRKLLRKCLILSVVSHFLIVRYGQPLQWAQGGLGTKAGLEASESNGLRSPDDPGIRSIEIIDMTGVGATKNVDPAGRAGVGSGNSGVLPAEIPDTLPTIDSATPRPNRNEPPVPELTLDDRAPKQAVELPEAPLAQSLPTSISKPERPANSQGTVPETAITETKPAEIAASEGPPAIASKPANQAVSAKTETPLPLPESTKRVVRIPSPRQPEGPVRTTAEGALRREQVTLPSVPVSEFSGPVVANRSIPNRSMRDQANRPTGRPVDADTSPLVPADDLAPPVPTLSRNSDDSVTSSAPAVSGGSGLAMNGATGTVARLPETTLRDRIRSRNSGSDSEPPTAVRSGVKEQVPLPKPELGEIALESLANDRTKRLGNRPLQDVPAAYRSRLDPNRARLAIQAGASSSSEKSVEMALDWLRKHQDADGRWDGGLAKYRDGSVSPDEDSFTVHCPPGEICFGECFYWEADTALTGLSLLAYLGSGYTHTEGKYTDTVAKGLDFLIRSQKANGDLRGRSVAVGMYCHAMATLAICEAYALTGDERLKKPAASAITFLVDAQAEGGAAWRYEPKAPVGDTSILGWVVLALRSGRSVGFPVPDDCIGGIQAWLDGVGSGKSGGLSRYQPWKEVTPTMTAEAWVCRWFLKLDPNVNRNRESADYLLQHGPDRDPYNLYYWYYGTLAMFQQGGEDWTKWNNAVRDRIVKKQRTTGHMAGSWDPDDSQWGTYGGRIYCTALATMTLEVYYRFLRTYDESR